MGQQPCSISFCWVLCRAGSQTHWEGASSWKDLRELVAWPFKFDIEQFSIVLHPCLHLVFVTECKLTRIIAYIVLTNNVLVCAVHLFGDTENTITIWGYHGVFLFVCLRLCQPDGMLCHALGMNVGSFCPLGLRHHASLLQGTIGFELCMLLSYSFVHQVSDFHRWFLERPQTSMAASKQKLWTKLTQRDLQYQHRHQQRWQLQPKVAWSLSFQVRMHGENLRFFTLPCDVVWFTLH